MATAKNITVFGGGSFGTALAYCVAKNGNNVTILTRNKEVVKSINEEHTNCKYLGVNTLPTNIKATSDAEQALKKVDFIIHAIPVQSSENYLKRYAKLISETTPIISSSKGIHTENLDYMSEIIPRALGREQPTAFISGPSFAKELLKDMPTGFVIASEHESLRTQIRDLFSRKEIRVYLTDDVLGVELGGALKNVFAIAAGISDGMGLGMNSLALLVTRGNVEMRSLAIKMGASPTTLTGLAGIGDLMATSFSPLSRNRTLGKRLGEGETLKEILDSMNEVAEGVATAPAAQRLAEKHHLKLPIIGAVSQILQGKIAAKDALNKLLELNVEVEFDHQIYEVVPDNE